MKILLAEDDKNLGRLLQNLLKKENIKLTGWKTARLLMSSVIVTAMMF